MRRRKLVLPKKNAPQTAASTLKPAAKPVRPLAGNFVRIWAPTLVTALFIITFNVQAFEIPSGSMEKTLKIGDHVLVDRIRFAPAARYMHGVVPYHRLRHGDIVVFMSVVQPDLHLVKRVIGLPGDHVTSAGNGAPVTVNGVALKEPYVAPGSQPSSMAFDVVVPADSLWVMGDNRDHSSDSRYHQGNPGGGSVPEANVVGVAFVIVWPLQRMTVLHNPSATFAGVPNR